MNNDDREIIQSNISKLMENIDLSADLTAKFLERRLFSREMLESYCPMEKRENKLRLLLDVAKRGPTAFEDFLHCLMMTGHFCAARILKPDLELWKYLPPISRDELDNRGIENGNVSSNGINSISHEEDAEPDTVPFLNDSFCEDQIVVPQHLNVSVQKTDTCHGPPEAYKMQSNPRGQVLIINNEKFQRLKERRGATVDTINFRNVFEQLHFEVQLEDNLGIADMKRVIKNFAQSSLHKNSDCCVVLVMSHGDQQDGSYIVYSVDQKPISVEWIIQNFSNEEAQSLRGKPKLFFFQACRGEGYYREPRRKNNLEKDSFREDSYTAPVQSDIFVANSAIPDYVSYRDIRHGSWFIESICQVFAKYAHCLDLQSMMQKVHERLSKYEGEKGEKQSAEYWMIPRYQFLRSIYSEESLIAVTRVLDNEPSRERASRLLGIPLEALGIKVPPDAGSSRKIKLVAKNVMGDILKEVLLNHARKEHGGKWTSRTPYNSKEGCISSAIDIPLLQLPPWRNEDHPSPSSIRAQKVLVTVSERTDGTPIAKGEDDDDAYDQYFYEEMAKSRLEGDNTVENQQLHQGLSPLEAEGSFMTKIRKAKVKVLNRRNGIMGQVLKDENVGKGILNRSSREGQPVLQSKTSADLVPIRARKVLQPVQSQSSSVKQDLRKSSSILEPVSSSKSENMGKAALGNQTEQSHHVEGRSSTPVGGKPSVNSKPSTSSSPNSSALNLPKHTKVSFNGCQYIVLGLIGKGGFSSVYQVWDPEKEMTYALKCIKMSQRESEAELRNEIQLLWKLKDCDRVIHLFDYEFRKSERTLYLLMERGDCDLQTIFKQKPGQWSTRECCFYFEQMLQAVQQIHAKNVIHADLKPANFIMAKGYLKLIDFGISCMLQNEATSVLRDTPHGTISYMSPEALENSRDFGCKIGTKSDIWSLGCILYQMIHGCTPFQHLQSLISRIDAIRNPNTVISYPSVADDGLQRIVKLCLQHDPKKRPSVSELLIMMSQTGQSNPHGPTPGTPGVKEYLHSLSHLSPGALQKAVTPRTVKTMLTLLSKAGKVMF
ncbi:unnamed protein product [Darwinula stevensoni]|uniref:Protein kinase domain-containing protein n=1 Tax=Darwinula stevensoni TaxID=69355 RepID=A0A7R9ABN4_9CRUS|nr:unnamed protein product [Darwinula stevensoni]CAG0899406.1 unnamed protein product [Darwinula stevensoni]